MSTNILKVLAKVSEIATYWEIIERVIVAVKLGKNGDDFNVENKISIKNKHKVLGVYLRDQTEEELGL